MSSRFSQCLCVLASVTAHALASPLQSRTPQCMDGVLVVAVRGSDSSWVRSGRTDPDYTDIGDLQPIAEAVMGQIIHNSRLSAVPYPATLFDYLTSLGNGIDAFQSLITSYVDSCSNPRLVVLGYSQGATVVSGGLIGGQGRPGLDYDKYGSKIIGGAIFADPSFVTGLEPLDAGNSTTNGTFSDGGAKQTALNDLFGDRFRSYCQAGDMWCADAGPSGSDIHHAEVATYASEATNFLLGVI